MIRHTYIISNGPQHQQVAIEMEDGATFFVNLGTRTASVTKMPDDEHYPNEICHGVIPTEFDRR